ncbi:MAG: hypothetical protein LBP67_05040 [Bacteroidales bacterium]|jgi:hypothetical protein|nr:hypothetical protein [Bacteroidales bacterium]
MICKCPRGANLPIVPKQNCPVNFGQIQRAAFQRLYKSDGTKNQMTLPELKATWEELLTSYDDSLVVLTPILYSPTMTAGDVLTSGGGNDSPDGIEEVEGYNPTTFTATVKKANQKEVIKPLKDLMCEEIGVVLFDGWGQMRLIDTGDVDTEGNPYYEFIPITAFGVSDVTSGIFGASDFNTIQWSFYPNWSDNTVILKASDFFPVRDLIPVVEN